MSSSSFCANLGLPYDCAQPLPRSAFNPSGPLCESLDIYLYDPANCDAGYWCGCSSSDPTECFPSNQTEGEGATKWGGHFTTLDKDTEDTVVFVGLFNGTENKCPLHYYCPGKNEPYRCVDLCEPKMVCADPGEMLPCPKGKYCPVATVEPKSCQGLEACDEEGMRRFKVAGGAGVMLCIILLAITYLFVGRNILNRRGRKAKLAKLAVKNRQGHGEEDTHGALSDEEHPPPEGPRRGSLYGKPGEGTSLRRSTLTPPEMNIDIEFNRLSLVIPHVGTIMTGVSGKIGEFGGLLPSSRFMT